MMHQSDLLVQRCRVVVVESGRNVRSGPCEWSRGVYARSGSSAIATSIIEIAAHARTQDDDVLLRE